MAVSVFLCEDSFDACYWYLVGYTASQAVPPSEPMDMLIQSCLGLLTDKKSLVGLKRTWDQKLSSCLTLVMLMTTHFSSSVPCVMLRDAPSSAQRIGAMRCPNYFG